MNVDVSALLKVVGLPEVTQHISRNCRTEPKAPESWPSDKPNCIMRLFVSIKRSIYGKSLLQDLLRQAGCWARCVHLNWAVGHQPPDNRKGSPGEWKKNLQVTAFYLKCPNVNQDMTQILCLYYRQFYHMLRKKISQLHD